MSYRQTMMIILNILYIENDELVSCIIFEVLNIYIHTYIKY